MGEKTYHQRLAERVVREAAVLRERFEEAGGYTQDKIEHAIVPLVEQLEAAEVAGRDQASEIERRRGQAIADGRTVTNAQQQILEIGAALNDERAKHLHAVERWTTEGERMGEEIASVREGAEVLSDKLDAARLTFEQQTAEIVRLKGVAETLGHLLRTSQEDIARRKEGAIRDGDRIAAMSFEIERLRARGDVFRNGMEAHILLGVEIAQESSGRGEP